MNNKLVLTNTNDSSSAPNLNIFKILLLLEAINNITAFCTEGHITFSSEIYRIKGTNLRW